MVLPCLALSLLVAASGTALAQGLTLGEPDQPETLDLGAPADPATGTARPTGPTQPPATRPVPDAPASSASDALAPAPGGGVPLTRETFGAWEVACAENGQCAMAQIGNDANGTPILEMVVRKLPEPVAVGDRQAIAVLDIVTPLGVVLTEGVGLTIDGGRTEAAPFQICTEQGCLVREPVDADLITRLKRGNTATVGITAAAQGAITSSLSLTGFTKAYDTVK